MSEIEMRKIDLRPYLIMRIDQKIPYDVKQMLVNILFFRISGDVLYSRIPVADKIRTSDDFVCLEESEYKMLKEGVGKFPSFGSNDEKLVKRIFEAEKVEMEEKKEAKK